MSITYQRRFPADLEQDQEAGGYLRPQEHVDPDEDLLISQIRGATVADTRRLPEHAAKDDPSFHEPHWGHGTGLLQGTLAIDSIEALPERFRVGLFEQHASYPVVCRPNFFHEKKVGLAAGRLAIKVRYPGAVPNVYEADGEARELDLLVAEGSPELNGVGHAFFFRDARELAMLTTLNPPSPKAARTLLDPRNWPVLARVLRRVRAASRYARKPPATTTGWAGKTYYSLGPFALGEGAMKFSLRPRQTHAISPIDLKKTDPTRPHRAAMEAWVAAGEDAAFDLCVQLATPESIPAPADGDPPKSVMAAEYTDLQWDESRSPYLKVGTLTFPATPEADLSRTYPWSPLQSNAWNTLPTMHPLGQLFRVRKHVHEGHSEVRLEHLYDAEPGAMVDAAPFEAGQRTG